MNIYDVTYQVTVPDGVEPVMLRQEIESHLDGLKWVEARSAISLSCGQGKEDEDDQPAEPEVPS